MFSHVLVEFIFRLTFGVAAAMALTPARWVISGFYRVHLWVLLGLQTLAALASYSATAAPGVSSDVISTRFWLAVAAAIASYIGAVIWMYERPLAGKMALWMVAALAVAGTLLPLLQPAQPQFLWHLADRFSSGLLLGLVTTSMLLGHWYLNTPTMKLEPLRRLVLLLAIVVCARMLIDGGGAWLETKLHLPQTTTSPTTWFLFLSLRWLAGLVGVLLLAGLTWQTLKIPNTQSATGILYAAVILAFIGELSSQLLSAQARYPV